MMKWRQGSATIEAMIIVPLLFFIIVLMIDALIIQYNRSRAYAIIDTVTQNMSEHLMQSPDFYTTIISNDLMSGNIAADLKASRSLNDMLHLKLSEENLASRLAKELDIKGRSSFELSTLRVTPKLNWFSDRYIVEYQGTIISPFQFMTAPILDKARLLSGSVTLDSISHLRRMNDMEIVIDRIERIEEIEKLFRSMRQVIAKWLAILS